MITDFVSLTADPSHQQAAARSATDARSLTTESILGIHVAWEAAQLHKLDDAQFLASRCTE